MRKNQGAFSPNILKLRWLNVQTYEIVLSNGKVILVDPQFSDPLPEDEQAKYYKIPDQFGITREWVERVDYILLSHSHCDHCIDLGYFVKRFNPMVICSENAAYAVAEAFDIPFTSIFAVGNQERYEFDDFTLHTIRGSHMPQGFTRSNMPNIMDKSYGITGAGTAEVGYLGGLFNTNYMITTRENLRIGLMSGRLDHYIKPALREMAGLQPNVYIRQIPPRLPPNPAMVFAEELAIMGAALMLPMHHESFVIARQEFFAQLLKEINKNISDKGCASRIISPERGKWYHIHLGFQLIDES